MPTPVSGTQHVLRAGDHVAHVASIGASLRALRRGDRDLIAPFGADELRPSMRGALLAPWPNRTANGEYEFGGRTHRLPLTEPELMNAAHGLVAWLDFVAVAKSADALTLRATIEPQPGYPWRVRVDTIFRLSADGLDQEVVALNEADTAAPFGMGGHPYLVAGPARPRAIDAWSLQIPATEMVLVDPERLLPVGSVDVRDGDARFDFRTSRTIGDTTLNHAFTGLVRDPDGAARVRVLDADGDGAEVVWDERCPWVQIYTADGPGTGSHRHAVAVEPTTCPPDALNSKRDLATVEPGATVSAAWSIRAVDGQRMPRA
nr:aldose 1-epimerase family protein [Microbacterium sulfonylureivorans]